MKLAAWIVFALGADSWLVGGIQFRNSTHQFLASSSNATRQLPEIGDRPGTGVAVRGGKQYAVSRDKSDGRVPFSPRAEPEIGSVYALYYSSYSGHQATSVEAPTSASQPEYEYRAVPEESGYVFDPSTDGMLPKPSCPLQVSSQTGYPSDIREANHRLVAILLCNFLASRMESLPDCGHSTGQVCSLKLFAPLPASDLQEPHLGMAMAVAGYSRLCSLNTNEFEQARCAVHRSETALTGGLRWDGNRVNFHGLPSPGFIDMKMNDAYTMAFAYVILPEASRHDYQETQFHQNSTDVLKWQRTPPEAHFCDDLHCLVNMLLPVR